MNSESVEHGARALRARLKIVKTRLWRLWPLLATTLAALGVYRLGVEPFSGIAAALVASWIAYRFRVGTLAALAVIVFLPQVMHGTAIFPEGWDMLGNGVALSDLILVGIWGATASLLFGRSSRCPSEQVFIRVFLVVAALAFTGIARNWGEFGLSALGEFRVRFLILGLPMYMSLGLDAPTSRRLVARLLAALPLLGVLVTLPIVGTLKGWDVGATSRFYPSSVSLAVLLAAVWVGLITRGSQSGLRRGMAFGAFVLSGVLVVADSHRSVWLVAAATLTILLWLGVLRVRRAWAWGLPAVLGTAVVVAVVGSSGTQVATYVATRAAAFTDPLDDPTSYWRLVTWKAYVAPWLRNPLFGEGFGGYWDVYVPELGGSITTSPHSMYVQTLVKLGLLGMLGLLGWFAVAWRVLLRMFRLPSAPSATALALAPMGLVAVGGALVYGTVYALEFWTLAWMGLALAEAFRGNRKPGCC